MRDDCQRCQGVALGLGTTSTPTLRRARSRPTEVAKCASVARRPRLTRLCDALSNIVEHQIGADPDDTNCTTLM
eukprot:6206653-Pleurochrysis_carterae.AAC.1